MSPEFQLAVDCCRRNFRGGGGRDAFPSNAVDWAQFLRLAKFHRIEGIAWNALEAADIILPAEVVAELSEAATRIAATNLRAAANSAQLLAAFDASDRPLLFLKGLTVAALGYSEPMLKSAVDVDVLIDPGDIGQAAALLRDAGYELVAPRSSAGDRVLRDWHGSWKESVWRSRSSGLQLDLHTRIADHARLLPRLDVHSARQWVEIGNGLRLPTFADDELFAYLAVHGASSCWFRLKWIADVAAFLSTKPGPEIERLHDRSQDLGAGRAAGLSLRLADHLFGTLAQCPELPRRLRRDRTIARLFARALRLLTGPLEEPTGRKLGTVPIHLTQLQLLPGVGYPLSHIRHHAARLLARARS